MINQSPWTFTKAVEINLSDMTLDTENELLNTFSSYPSLQNHLLLDGDDEINFRALCRGDKLRVHLLLFLILNFFVEILLFRRMKR